MQNIKLRNGITLLEIIVATSILTLVLFAGSGIYLSAWNMFRDAQFMAQAQRNAVVPMMHIEKTIQQGNYLGPQGDVHVNDAVLKLDIDDNGTPDNTADDDTINYTYVAAVDQITYDRYRRPENTNDSVAIIGTRISNCGFTYTGSDPVVDITIEATDNNGDNAYSITTSTEARYMSAQ